MPNFFLKFLAKNISYKIIGDFLQKKLCIFSLLVGNLYEPKYEQKSEFFW
jgi:hypothetical protein